jgi:hypothetical protein
LNVLARDSGSVENSHISKVADTTHFFSGRYAVLKEAAVKRLVVLAR